MLQSIITGLSANPLQSVCMVAAVLGFAYVLTQLAFAYVAENEAGARNTRLAYSRGRSSTGKRS